MKKLPILLMVVMLVMVSSAFALLSTITINIDSQTAFVKQGNYNSSGSGNDVMLRFNATATWTDPTNVTNVTFYLYQGSNLTNILNYTKFVNSTTNGSRTSVTAGDFSFNISASRLAEGTYTIIAEARNNSDTIEPSGAINSSSITFTIDRTNPSVLISNPLSGSTVVPSTGTTVTFEYTPSDSNMGNCSLHLNNQPVTSSNTITTSANATSGQLSRFSQQFSKDNNTVRLAIRCSDLAGLPTSSNAQNNFTFSVLLGSVPYAVQQLYSGSAGLSTPASTPASSSSAGFVAAPQESSSSSINYTTHLQKYGFIYVIFIVIIAAFAIRKFTK